MVVSPELDDRKPEAVDIHELAHPTSTPDPDLTRRWASDPRAAHECPRGAHEMVIRQTNLTAGPAENCRADKRLTGIRDRYAVM